MDKRHLSITLSSMMGEKTRPTFLNLFVIRQFVPAILSIGHRISGVLLFLLLPVVIYCLERSVESEEGFAAAVELCSSLPMRLLAVLMIWLFAHHLFAGIRFLLMDMDLWLEKSAATKSAWVVIGAGLVVLVVAGGLML